MSSDYRWFGTGWLSGDRNFGTASSTGSGTVVPVLRDLLEIGDGRSVDLSCPAGPGRPSPAEARWTADLQSEQGRQTPMVDFDAAAERRRLAHRRAELSAQAALDEASERRVAAAQAADRLSALRNRLLLELSDDQLEGRAPLAPAVAEAWQRAFPDRPVIDGHLATGAQMQRIQERQERRDTMEWLISQGRTLKQARAEVDREYGPIVTEAADGAAWDRYSKAVAQGQAEFEKSLGQLLAPPTSPSLDEVPMEPLAASAEEHMVRVAKAFGLSEAAAKTAAQGRDQRL